MKIMFLNKYDFLQIIDYLSILEMSWLMLRCRHLAATGGIFFATWCPSAEMGLVEGGGVTGDQFFPAKRPNEPQAVEIVS